jgi:SAM-dependent methyltransferase
VPRLIPSPTTDSAGPSGTARIYPMTRQEPEQVARAAFDRFVRWTIQEELGSAPTFLPRDELDPFLAYYRDLPAASDEVAIRRYLRGLWRSEAGWVARWIAARARVSGGRAGTIRVLDAGSGFGTYSMLFAAVGAEVVGADLRPDRLSAAERRLRFYGDHTGCSLPIQYERADLTRPWTRDCDLVWVYNALSHIDPLEDFLRLAREHLRPGGVLVVGDINGAHPSHVRRLAQLRTEIHQEYVAPDGQRHGYAVERPFPPEELRTILVANGYHVVHHELYWLGLSRLPEPVYQGLMAPLQRQWWLGVSVARRQLMVASPDPESARRIPA